MPFIQWATEPATVLDSRYWMCWTEEYPVNIIKTNIIMKTPQIDYLWLSIKFMSEIICCQNQFVIYEHPKIEIRKLKNRQDMTSWKQYMQLEGIPKSKNSGDVS